MDDTPPIPDAFRQVMSEQERLDTIKEERASMIETSLSLDRGKNRKSFQMKSGMSWILSHSYGKSLSKIPADRVSAALDWSSTT